MYVCFEGVKGSGKSTTIAAVLHRLDESGVHYGTVNPTRAAPAHTMLEAAALARPALRSYDGFNRRLYAARYNHAMAHADWSQSLILGDRSLLTTYVTRWRRWGDPGTCIAQVEQTHRLAPSPNKVIYLYAGIDVLTERLQRRVERTYGRQDETIERLIETMQAYDDIRLGRVDVPRLHGLEWHPIRTEQPLERTVEQCLQIVASAMEMA